MNVQVHCTRCDKSISQYGRMDLAALPGVQITVGHHSPQFNAVPDNAHAFCDWRCVAAWALDQQPKEEES